MNEWKEIKTQEDIEELLEAYDYFHDGCLTRAVFQSGTSVDEDLSMCFGDAEEYTLHCDFRAAVASENVGIAIHRAEAISSYRRRG